MTTTNVNSQKKKPRLKGLSLISLGWELAVPIFGGVFLGYQIDKLFNNSYIFTMVLLIAGIFVGYYNLYKTIELEMLRTKIYHRRSKQGE